MPNPFRRFHVRALALSLVALLSACASPPERGAPRVALPKSGPGGVAGVQIDANASTLPADRLASFEAAGGAGAAANAVASQLHKRAQPPCEAPCSMEVDVTRFRLRSSSNAFWLGMMAGADSIAVKVDGKHANVVVKSFQTDTSTVLGGIAFGSSVKRFDRLLATLAERIVAGL